MNLKIALSAVAIVALSAFGTASAGDKLTADEVKNLFSDPVVYQTSTGNSGNIFPNGKLSAQSSRSSSDGTWQVTEEGLYCNQWDNSRWTGECGAFEKTEDPNIFVRTTPSNGNITYRFKKQ